MKLYFAKQLDSGRQETMPISVSNIDKSVVYTDTTHIHNKKKHKKKEGKKIEFDHSKFGESNCSFIRQMTSFSRFRAKASGCENPAIFNGSLSFTFISIYLKFSDNILDIKYYYIKNS